MSKIFDCITFNENFMANLRFEILDKKLIISLSVSPDMIIKEEKS